MNNATAVVTRSMSASLRSPRWLSPIDLLRLGCQSQRCASSWAPNRISSPCALSRTRAWRAQCQRGSVPEIQSLSHFSTSPLQRLLKPYPETDEPGLSFRSESYSTAELAKIFSSTEGSILDQANRILRVIHARRIDGTLDIPLEEELQVLAERHPRAFQNAIEWLRARYPVDEDAAILERFKREDAPRQKENPSVLQQRAQNIGLFKPGSDTDAEALAAEGNATVGHEEEYYGPQSGAYYARLSDKDADPFGRSHFEAVRAANEARAEAEERKLQEDVEKSMEAATAQAEAKSHAIAARTSQEIEAVQEDDKQMGAPRPPNTFESWVIRNSRKATSELTLDSPEIANASNFSRAVPSFLFVILSCAGLYAFAQYWEAPRRVERWWQSVSLSSATIGTIILANAGVFLMWRLPGMWPMLNKFFMVVPAYPRPLSMLFNTFSHQSTRHLLTNMLGLLVFGPSLHEDLGRGNFVALYLASGLVGSWISLASHLVRGALFTSSMGASGCVWGVAAGYLWLHSEDRFTLFFLPQELKEQVQLKGWAFLSVMVVLDLVTTLRLKTIDVAAHLGGAIIGAMCVNPLKATTR